MCHFLFNSPIYQLFSIPVISSGLNHFPYLESPAHEYMHVQKSFSSENKY